MAHNTETDYKIVRKGILYRALQAVKSYIDQMGTSFGSRLSTLEGYFTSGKANTAVNAEKLGGTAASGYAKLDSPTFTGTPTAPTAATGTNTKQIATTAFVQAAIGAIGDAMVFKGTLGTSGTVTALPASHKPGDTYRVITAGTYAGQPCEVGDLVICITKGTSANDAHWTVAQNNLDGAVTGPSSATDAHVAVFNGATGKVIKDSGFTIGKSVPSNAVFTDTDTKVTSAGNHYAPSADDDAQLTAAISGSAGSYAKDTEYTVLTGFKLQRDAKGHVTGATYTAQKVKDTNTTYSAATESAAGLMSKDDKAKLNRIYSMEDVLVDGGLTASDISGDSFSFGKLKTSSHGSVTGVPGKLYRIVGVSGSDQTAEPAINYVGAVGYYSSNCFKPLLMPMSQDELSEDLAACGFGS